MSAIPEPSARPSSPYRAYLAESKAPLTCFLFTLPLFLIYHGGLWLLSTFEGFSWANAADIAIANILGRLGMAGPLLSFVFVVIVFLAWQVMSGKAWRLPAPSTWPLMAAESVIFAFPVFLASQAMAWLFQTKLFSAAIPLSAGGEIGVPLYANIVLSCGAGVYEEFLFRLLLLGILARFFGRFVGLKGGWLFAAATLTQAVLFAAFHHLPGGMEPVTTWTEAWRNLPVFGFRMLAGVYFAYLFLERGFGIAAGAHATYNVLILGIDHILPPAG